MREILYGLRDALSCLEPYKEEPIKASSAYWKLREQIEKIEKLAFAFPSENNHGMTFKQYAAIQLKVPRSGDPEIDGMIRESRRAEFVGQVLKGLFSGNGFVDETQAAYLAEQCHISADIMLAEWEKEAEK
jgi:hypothetical protein